MIQLLVKGGVVMIPIFICSIIALAIIIERAYVLIRLRRRSREFMPNLRMILEKEDYQQAKFFCEEEDFIVALIWKEGLERILQKKKDFKEVIAHKSEALVLSLEKGLNTLATVAHISPLLGLLGTVTGMIRAFMVVEQLAGRVNATSLAGGIWEALITTAAGLVVAIPAMAAHHYLVDGINHVIKEIEEDSYQLVSLIGDKDKPSGDLL